MFRGKKYQDAAKQIEKNTQYDAAEGFGLICKTASAKFDLDSKNVKNGKTVACYMEGEIAGFAFHLVQA